MGDMGKADINKAGMVIQQWAIDDVKPYPRNARKITDKAVAKGGHVVG
jgi:hypothetical protein